MNDIACIQETKTKQGELYETIVKHCPNAQVIECSNLDNHDKGGVAIVNTNDKINISKVLSDNELDSIWSDTIPAQDDNKYQVDNVLGKFMQVSFIFNDQVHDLVNVYFPVVAQIGRCRSVVPRNSLFLPCDTSLWVTQHKIPIYG